MRAIGERPDAVKKSIHMLEEETGAVEEEDAADTAAATELEEGIGALQLKMRGLEKSVATL